MSDSLGKVVLKYNGLRMACFAIPFAIAAAVLVPLGGQDGWFEAALVGIAASLPLAIWLGRDLRAQISVLLVQTRTARQAKVDETAARVKAVEDARRAASSD